MLRRAPALRNAAAPTPAPATASPASGPPDDPDLAALERRSGGRLGVHALDTGTGATVSHRGGSGSRDRRAGRAQRRRDRAAPDRAPLVLAVHTDPSDPDSTIDNSTIAGATAIAVRRLVGT